MLNSEPGVLAAKIEEAVRAVPSVTNVFRSGTLVSNAIMAAASEITGSDTTPLVSVTDRGDGIDIEVSIDADGQVAVPHTLRAVRDAVNGVADAHGVVVKKLRVTVARIHT